MSGVPQPKQGTKPKAAKKRKRIAKPRTDREVATRLHSKIIRSTGRCVAVTMWGIECSGNLEAAHIAPRRYAATRTDLANAVCLCHAHHYYMDTHDGCKRELVGSDFYDWLMLKAERGSREFSGLTPTLWWRSERDRLTEIARQRGLL